MLKKKNKKKRKPSQKSFSTLQIDLRDGDFDFPSPFHGETLKLSEGQFGRAALFARPDFWHLFSFLFLFASTLRDTPLGVRAEIVRRRKTSVTCTQRLGPDRS